MKLIKTLDKEFDVVYVDPPYMSGIYKEVCSLLKGKASIIVAEHSEELNITEFSLIKTKNYGGKKITYYIP